MLSFVINLVNTLLGFLNCFKIYFTILIALVYFFLISYSLYAKYEIISLRRQIDNIMKSEAKLRYEYNDALSLTLNKKHAAELNFLKFRVSSNKNIKAIKGDNEIINDEGKYFEKLNKEIYQKNK